MSWSRSTDGAAGVAVTLKGTLDMKAETQAAQDLLGLAKAASELLSVEEARARIVVAMPLLPAEKVRVASAAGRVLAEDIVAIVSLPPMPVSAMDGYAC